MRSLLGRFHRPFARGTEEQLLMLNNLGDGSTLSLDFTTGVLDPRLTFDRLSTATFINSSGLVQFANANLMTYSTPRASGSAWGTTGTVTWGSATITDPLGNATAQEVTFGTAASAIFNTAGTTVVSGITHTFSVWLRAASGTTNVRIGDANVGAVSTVTLTTTWQRFSCQYVASGTNDGGAIYSQTGTPSSTFYVWGAQVQPGSIVGELLETTGTLRRNTPRFDYDPTSIGTPRGLLIEGSANNLITYSDASTTGWTGLNVTGSNNNAISPDGTTSATLWTGIGGSSNRAYSATFNVTSGSTYTVSAWFKKPASNGSRYVKIYLLSSTESAIGWPSNGVLDLDTGTASGTGFTVTAYKDNWYRVVSTGTVTSTTSARAFIAMCTSTGGLLTTTESMLAWGCQVEAGSGASSYIPTGASQGSRAADSCTIGVDAGTATNFSSWWPLGQAAWTVLWTGDIVRATTAVQFLWLTRTSLGSSLMRVFANSTSGQPLIGFAGNTVPPASTVNGTPGALIRTALANQEGDQAFYANNGTVSSSGTATLTGIQTTSASMNFNPNGDQFMHIKTLKFWPTRLPNAQLQSLTT